MEAKCINPKGHMPLTLGKNYTVLNIDKSGKYFSILNDNGFIGQYYSDRFEYAENQINEKFYFYLEEVLSVARAERLLIKHKNWDNYVPVSDAMANIVFLIKDNKLDAADLNRKVWEVK